MRIAVPLLAVLLVVGCQKKSTPAKNDPTLAMHHIQLDSTTDGASCSASAIGPRALLTAAHCIVGTGVIAVDGETFAIDRILYDENDHAIILLQSAKFDHIAELAPRVPAPHEHVMFVGNPGHNTSIRRDGYFLKSEFVNFELVTMDFILPAFPGDSGSGLLSDDGKIIAVLSVGDKSAEAGAFPIAFTPEQLAQASK